MLTTQDSSRRKEAWINRVDYPYNLFDNIIEINRTLYNIQWEDKCLIITDNNRNRINIPPSADKLAELVIISYLVYLIIEGRVEQICFLLA